MFTMFGFLLGIFSKCVQKTQNMYISMYNERYSLTLSD